MNGFISGVWCASVVVLSTWVAMGSVSAQEFDVGIDGCFRQSGGSGVVCKVHINNNASSSFTTTFNTSNDGRTGGLDDFASWVWDQFGMQHQIIDAKMGGKALSNSISDWRVKFTVLGNMRIPGQFIVRGVPNDAERFARIKLAFSPKFNVSRGIKMFQFDDVPIE